MFLYKNLLFVRGAVKEVIVKMPSFQKYHIFQGEFRGNVSKMMCVGFEYLFHQIASMKSCNNLWNKMKFPTLKLFKEK